jgi:hypothetical protein
MTSLAGRRPSSHQTKCRYDDGMWTSFILLFLCGAASTSERPGYIDLTQQFSKFFDETSGMEEAARVARFHERMGSLLPGFYQPRFGLTSADYDAHIARALKSFPEIRTKYERVQREFPVAYAAGIAHFRKVFPGFTPHVPVYLVHSVGEMDGGTRDLNGKTYLIFGADVIAQIHDAGDITPFLDHELFHVENGKYFTDCGEVWCTLWAEGLATHAAKVMNPGASDQQLLLTVPKPIRPAVDASWPAAACFTREKLFSSETADIEAFFVGGAAKDFPDRFGYYVALRAVEELGGGHSLQELAHMPPERAKSALTQSLDRLIEKAGGCED